MNGASRRECLFLRQWWARGGGFLAREKTASYRLQFTVVVALAVLFAGAVS